MTNAECFESISKLYGIDPEIYAKAYDRCRGEGRSRRYIEGYARGLEIAYAEKYSSSRTEGYTRGYATGYEESSLVTLWVLSQDGTITIDKAAEEYGASPEVFLEKVKEQFEQSPFTMEEAATECVRLTLSEFWEKYFPKKHA